MKYLAICFDLDGVIINSEPLHEAAFREALAKYDLPLSAANYLTYFAGKTDKQGFIDYLLFQSFTRSRNRAPRPKAAILRLLGS